MQGLVERRQLISKLTPELQHATLAACWFFQSDKHVKSKIQATFHIKLFLWACTKFLHSLQEKMSRFKNINDLVRWLYSLRRPARGDVGEEEGCIIKRDQVYLKLIRDGINIQEVEYDSLLKYTVAQFEKVKEL